MENSPSSNLDENIYNDSQDFSWKKLEELADKMDDDVDAMDVSGKKYTDSLRKADKVNPENTKDYNVDRRSQNYQMLLEKDQDLAKLYKDILTEFPELSNVELLNFDTKKDGKNGKPNAYFSALSMRGGQYRPIVKFNFNEPEVYFDGSEGDGDALSLAQSVKKIALKVGVNADEALKNRKFMTSFLLLHELGHALDFKRNYLDATGGDLAEAYRLNRENRRRDEMTMPIPGAVEIPDIITAEYMEDLNRRFGKRFRGMGIHNSEQLKLVMARKYREMHSERMADSFARDYVLRHYGEFFTQSNSSQDKRLKTQFEKPVLMGEDFAEVLGLEEGTRVRFTLISKPENLSGSAKPGDMIEGYLSETAKPGDKIVLQKTNDPNNPGKKITVSEGVKNVFIVPHAAVTEDSNGRSHRSVKNEIVFTDVEGRIYKIEKARNQAKEIKGDTAKMLEELNKKLGLKAGSEIQLLKREISSRDASPVQEGELKMGNLITDGITSEGVEMTTEDGGYLKTSFIDSIYREWKTFFINTATSTYEVIPVKNIIN